MNKKDLRKKNQESNKYFCSSNIQLLDFLLMNIKGLSRNNIKTILKNGCVLIKGQVVTQYDYMLVPGTVVEITKKRNNKVQTPNNKDVNLSVIYEDDEFVVIDKPSGLLTISTDKEKEKTAYHYVLNYCKNKDKQSKIFILHRLDRDTSGVIVFCKDIKLRNLLQDDWNNLVKEREYYAVCKGILAKKKDKLVNYLGESKTHFVYISDNLKDQKAITNFEVIKENTNSLLKINLETGRKNQIRVQLANINHPIIGDEKYGDNKNKRLYLHSSLISFVHPLNNKPYVFKSELPKDFLTKV